MREYYSEIGAQGKTFENMGDMLDYGFQQIIKWNARTGENFFGQTNDRKNEIGPLITQDHRNKVSNFVEKAKKYSDCRDILDKKDGLTGRKTLCDTIELITINKSIDYYRVTFDLYGETFTLKLKKRPVSTTMTMVVSLYPYDY